MKSTANLDWRVSSVLAFTLCVVVAISVNGCRKTKSPNAQPTIKSTAPSGMFYAIEELSQIDTGRVTSRCFPRVYWGSADGQLAYVIVTDLPMGSNGRLDYAPHYVGSTLDEGSIEIEGRIYRLGSTPVMLVKTYYGPDHVHQITIPPGASDPKEAVREMFERYSVFRDFVREILTAHLDSMSFRVDAAIGLYKSKLAAELPEAELRDWLDDDSPSVRLMAASGLWDRNQAPEAIEVLSLLAENEPVDSWSARLARRELTRIRAQHSQPTTSAPSSASGS